jgi:hypothetical protein
MVHQTSSFAKDETAQLVAQLLDLRRITSSAKAFGELKEILLFLLGGFDALLDEVHQDAVIAESALLCDGLDLFSDSWG